MRQFLSLLTPLRAGMSLLDALTAERINAIQECIFALTRGDNVQKCSGVRKRHGPDGYSLSVDFPPPRGLTPPHPFKILSRLGDSGQVLLKVNPLSTILKGDDWEDVQTISGLTSEWAGTPNEKIWINAAFDGEGLLTSTTLSHGTTPWAEYPAAHTGGGDDGEGGEEPSNWYQMIAYLRPATADETADMIFSTGDRQKIVPCTTTNLIVSSKCSTDAEKRLIRVLAPWAGGVIPPEEEG